MATHSSILAGRLSWTEGPGGLNSMVSMSQKDLETKQHYFMYIHILYLCVIYKTHI